MNSLLELPLNEPIGEHLAFVVVCVCLFFSSFRQAGRTIWQCCLATLLRDYCQWTCCGLAFAGVCDTRSEAIIMILLFEAGNPGAVPNFTRRKKF